MLLTDVIFIYVNFRLHESYSIYTCKLVAHDTLHLVYGHPYRAWVNHRNFSRLRRYLD